jgi:hypothetical protein
MLLLVLVSLRESVFGNCGNLAKRAVSGLSVAYLVVKKDAGGVEGQMTAFAVC